MTFIEITPNIRGHLERVRKGIATLQAFRAAQGRSLLDYSGLLTEVERQDETASRRYTVAFVGMYNCGKSTILNSLLGLRGDARLSDQDSPDTAKSIRISHRASPEEPECLLHFDDKTSEACTWAQARAFTSQVYLDEHPEARARAAKLVEVEYRIDDPLLLSLDFLDLPGTGTSNWRIHTVLTHQRLKEAELIFWVIGTCAPEPAGSDLEDLRILKEVKAHVVPLINVWSDEEEGITGEVTPEAMEEAIRTHLAAFFAAGAPILRYYAREIDRARQRGVKLRPEWGFEKLVEYLSSLLGTDSMRRERIRRIGGAVLSQIRRLKDLVESDAQLLKEVGSDLASADDKLREQEEDRLEIGRSLRPHIRELAEGRSREVVAMLHDAASAFIEDELRLSNWTLLVDMVRRTPAAVVRDRMRDRFRDDYLKLGVRPHWIDRLHQEFLEDVYHVVHGAWARFLRNLQIAQGQKDAGTVIGSEFLDNAMGQISGALLQRGFLVVLTGIFTYLLFVPGGLLIDVVSVLGLVLFQIFQDPLEKSRNNAKLRAKVTLEANRIEIRNVFTAEGIALHEGLDRAFGEELKRQGAGLSADRQSLQDARKALDGVRAELASFEADMTAFEKGALG